MGRYRHDITDLSDELFDLAEVVADTDSLSVPAVEHLEALVGEMHAILNADADTPNYDDLDDEDY